MIDDELTNAALEAFSDRYIKGDCTSFDAMRAALEAYEAAKPDKWQPIETAPRDDSEFMIGRWFYEHEFWDDKKNEWVEIGKREWVQTISHHENPDGPHACRGWNHRNGPINKPTHYRPLPEGPKE